MFVSIVHFVTHAFDFRFGVCSTFFHLMGIVAVGKSTVIVGMNFYKKKKEKKLIRAKSLKVFKLKARACILERYQRLIKGISVGTRRIFLYGKIQREFDYLTSSNVIPNERSEF